MVPVSVPGPFDPAGESLEAFLAADELELLLVAVFLAVVAFLVAVFLAVAVFFAVVFLAGAFFTPELEVPVDVAVPEPAEAALALLAEAVAGFDSASVEVALDPVRRSSAGALSSPSGSGTSGTHGSAGGS